MRIARNFYSKRTLFAGCQIFLAFAWAALEATPPSVAHIPDSLIDVVIPSAVLALFIAGLVVLFKSRASRSVAVIVGTAFSGAVLAFAVLITTLGIIAERLSSNF